MYLHVCICKLLLEITTRVHFSSKLWDWVVRRMKFAFLLILVFKVADSGNVPDTFDIFVKPIYDIYELKHPLVNRVIDFTNYNKVKRCLLSGVLQTLISKTSYPSLCSIYLVQKTTIMTRFHQGLFKSFLLYHILIDSTYFKSKLNS